VTTALLIMLREGFEAALVVAIVFAYLRKLDRLHLARSVWAGVGAAAVASTTLGIAVHLTVGTLEGAARLHAFAAVSFVAACVLTWMVFWMRRQSRLIKGDLEHRVDRALAASRVGFALAMVAFLAVLREGIEAALFLIAAATEESGRDVLVGGLLGLGLAVIAAYGVYWGGRSLPLRAFFKVTGVVLIVFAAGLLARTVLYLQSAGDVSSFNLNGVYDLRGYDWLSSSNEIGKFLSAMFGWDPRPSIEQVVVWFAYLIPVLYLFLRSPRPAVDPPPESDPPPEPAGSVGTSVGTSASPPE
jgi:high-affinity iron transporter